METLKGGGVKREEGEGHGPLEWGGSQTLMKGTGHGPKKGEGEIGRDGFWEGVQETLQQGKGERKSSKE